MYCIAVLIDEEQKGQDYAEYILNYCADRKIFPLVQIYQDHRFIRIRKSFLERYKRRYQLLCFWRFRG